MTDHDPELTFDTRDEFHRRGIAQKVVELLRSDVDVSPMVIDGKWGTGKTEFCNKLINLIHDSNNEADVEFKCAYIDAFKADHADDPLATLVAAVANLIDDDEQRASFITKAVPTVRFGLKVAGKAGVAWLLKQNAEDIGDEYEHIMKEAAEKSIDAAVESIIKDHQEASKNLEALRQAMKQIAAETPLVVFVDELDRCKPDFAVSILENVKHVFDVDNVQFVIVANFEQLKATINHCYGVGVQAQRYLDKFVKFNFRLPAQWTTDNHNYTVASVTHVTDLLKARGELVLTLPIYMSVIETLTVENELSLREVETFVRFIEVFHILSGGNAFAENTVIGYGLLRLLAVYYFCFQKDICDEVARNYVDGPNMAGVLGHTSFPELLDYYDVNASLAALIYFESSVPVDAINALSNEEKAAWRGHIDTLFPQAMGPGEGEKVSIIRQAIRTLAMTTG